MDRYRITFRIWHPTRPAAAICAELPVAPDRTVNVGAIHIDRKRHTARLRGRNLLYLPSLDEGAGRLAEMIIAAAEQVAPYRNWFEPWRAEGGRVEFFVGRFIEGGHSGDAFEPDLPTRLGELGIRLSPDIYSVDHDQNDIALSLHHLAECSSEEGSALRRPMRIPLTQARNAGAIDAGPCRRLG